MSMLGNIAQLTNLLKNAGKIKQNMAEMQSRLEAARYVGESGGGQVQATVDGRAEVVSLRIAPALVQSGDVELLEDLVSAAVNAAVRLSREGVAREMQSLTGGMEIPGLTDMLGGGRV